MTAHWKVPVSQDSPKSVAYRTGRRAAENSLGALRADPAAVERLLRIARSDRDHQCAGTDLWDYFDGVLHFYADLLNEQAGRGSSTLRAVRPAG